MKDPFCLPLYHATVHPLPKKTALDPVNFFNYRLKKFEPVVLILMKSYLFSVSPMESAYLLFIMIKLALVIGQVTAFILDLFSAFDSVDHSIYLHCLQHWFEVSGLALNWFATYLFMFTHSVR